MAGGEPKALEPMPWRTDQVSSTACDRCPYADHAAVNVMQQGVQRRPVAPKGRRPGLRLGVCTRQLCTPQNRLP